MHWFLPFFPTLLLLKQFASAITFYYNSKMMTEQQPDYFLHFHLKIAQLLLHQPSKHRCQWTQAHIQKNSITTSFSVVLSGTRKLNKSRSQKSSKFLWYDFCAIVSFCFVSTLCQKFYCCDIWAADEGFHPRSTLFVSEVVKKTMKNQNINERFRGKHTS